MGVERLRAIPGFNSDTVAAAAGDDPDVLRGWGGEIADRHARFVFSTEPVERIALLEERVRAALGP